MSNVQEYINLFLETNNVQQTLAGGSFSLCDNDYDYDIAAEWVLDSLCVTVTVTSLIQFKSSKLKLKILTSISTRVISL